MSIGQAALAHLVYAARVERVTSEQPRQPHPRPSSRSILVHGLPRVLRAARMKPAGRWEDGGDEELVAPDEKQYYLLHVSMGAPGNDSAGTFRASDRGRRHLGGQQSGLPQEVCDLGHKLVPRRIGRPCSRHKHQVCSSRQAGPELSVSLPDAPAGAVS